MANVASKALDSVKSVKMFHPCVQCYFISFTATDNELAEMNLLKISQSGMLESFLCCYASGCRDVRVTVGQSSQYMSKRCRLIQGFQLVEQSTREAGGECTVSEH